MRRVLTAAATAAAALMGSVGAAQAVELPKAPDVGGLSAVDTGGVGEAAGGAAETAGRATGAVAETAGGAVGAAAPVTGETTGAAAPAVGQGAGSAAEMLGETAKVGTEGALPVPGAGLS
ncbi:hypothetical protein [Streptomyces sp. MOE7]|uniref:hypothetical protein n=1 Tax=Streptomyces sp. MOE7 TaxID=1961713 RepID=UPI000A014A07|nr:hypothetical protein [Streptomyces sp. MOE7]ARH90964.1 hypothetical protein STRMOE7_12275 [Streptomyces sp. MOE7]